MVTKVEVPPILAFGKARAIAVGYFGLRVLVRSGLSFEDIEQAALAVLDTI